MNKINDCIFCRIIAKELPSKIVYEDEAVIAFEDIEPKAPVHVVLIPKMHVDRLENVKDCKIIADLFEAVKKIVSNLSGGDLKDGYRVVVNSGGDGGQTVSHLHFHIMGGRQMKWPPG